MCSFSSIPSQLEQLGYKQVPVVSDKGEFSVRGGIIDIFPLSSFDPYRLEFFGDEIEEIRTFDPISQKSSGKVVEIFLSPASEVDLISQEKNPCTILDYLRENTLVIFNDLLALEDEWVSLKSMPASKARTFGTFEEFLLQAKPLFIHYWSAEPAEMLSEVEMKKKVGRSFYSGKTPLQPLTFEMLGQSLEVKRWLHPFCPIPDYFCLSENKAAQTQEEILLSIHSRSTSPIEIHFLSATEAEERAFKETLEKEKISLPAKTQFHSGYLSNGFVLMDANVALIPMTEFTHRLRPRRQKWRSTHPTPAAEFHELTPEIRSFTFTTGLQNTLGLKNGQITWESPPSSCCSSTQKTANSSSRLPNPIL